MSTPATLMIEFVDAPTLARTLRILREEGYSRLEVYEPYPSEEIDALMPEGESPLRWVMLVVGLCGCAGAYFLQWYAARDYPVNVGGRPLHSWPAFVPVTFELTVLSTAFAGVIALLWLTRLPRLDHPAFAHPHFERASQDRFFIRIFLDDPRYTAVGLDKVLRSSGALSIVEVDE